MGDDLDQWGFPEDDDSEVDSGDVELRGATGFIDTQDEARFVELQGYRDHYQKLVDNRKVDRKFHEQQLAMLSSKLIPFENRAFKRPLGFVPVVQLTVESKDTVKYQFPSYKLCLAIRSFRSKFFGANRTISVKSMEVELNRKWLRCPRGLQFAIRNLKIRGALGSTLDDLAPILSDSSFPLESLETDIYEVEEMKQKNLICSKKLIISDAIPECFNAEFLEQLEHKNVHFSHYDILHFDEYFNLIYSWHENGKCVGTRYSFGFGSEKAKIEQLWQEFLMEDDFFGLENESIFVLVDQKSRIKIHKEEVENKWNLIFEVVPV